MSLTPHQQAALDRLNTFLGDDCATMATLEGYAGVGKTFLMGEFLRLAKAAHSVCVAAPTHKALKVICSALEASGSEISAIVDDEPDDLSGGMFAVYQRKQSKKGLYAATVHSLLALRLTELENGETECKPDPSRLPSLSEYDLVVIDESSLISKRMLEMIITHKKAAKVLFIGDPAQLPPIEDKNAISPVFTHIDNKISLTEVVRQAADNPIIKVSMAIRQAVYKFSPQDFMAHLPPLPASAACLNGSAQMLIDFAASEQLDGRDARVLCYRNNTVSHINQSVHERLHPGTLYAEGEKLLCYFCSGNGPGEKSPFLTASGSEYKARLMDEFTVVSAREDRDQFGVSVMMLALETEIGSIVNTQVPIDRQSYQREINAIWNEYRSVNTAHELEKDHSAKNQLKDKKKSLSRKAYAMRNKYPDLRHAYAMTVHRSQGSTFDTALVHYADINTMRSSFEFNRALYVACTRPRQYLAVVV